MAARLVTVWDNFSANLVFDGIVWALLAHNSVPGVIRAAAARLAILPLRGWSKTVGSNGPPPAEQALCR